jgi:hypothetical protein
MARALMGYVGSASEHALALEVARLRRRVNQLEAELAELRSADEPAPDASLDLELHRLAADSTPALA